MRLFKKINPVGVYYFNHQYCPTPCLIISPRPGRMAERAWLQPLPRMSLTRGSLVKLRTRFSVYFNTLARGHLLNTTVLVINFFHHHTHANGKLQTKGPSVTPSQVSQSLGNPIRPPMEARSVLVQDGKNSLLGARMRRTTITPRWQLIQAF